MSVRIQSLNKHYGAQKALNDLSLDIQEGEILGFLGPNGAGKSTTMKIITGYLSSDSGSVKICGFDIQEDTLKAQKLIGYLPENNPLYHEMYVYEYLQFIAGIYKIKGKQLKQRILEVIELCGLNPEKNKKIGQLSKGYKQRVGLAQALIHDPKVLILDEPTTGLDPNQLVEIRALIKKISQNKTVIFSTHIMQEVEALCTRVVIIKKGNIVTDQSIEDVKKLNSNSCYEVEFDHEIEEKYLIEIEGLEKLEKVNQKSFRVYANRDIRGDLYKKSIEQNWILIGLQKSQNSIESIFQKLTSL